MCIVKFKLDDLNKWEDGFKTYYFNNNWNVHISKNKFKESLENYKLIISKKDKSVNNVSLEYVFDSYRLTSAMFIMISDWVFLRLTCTMLICMYTQCAYSISNNCERQWYSCNLFSLDKKVSVPKCDSNRCVLSWFNTLFSLFECSYE